jgi:hypothetical protein
LDSNCSICDSSNNIEMPHIHSLKYAEPRIYAERKRAMNRKQIPVCKTCHSKIHNGIYDGVALNKVK